MNIDDLTIGDAKRLATMFSSESHESAAPVFDNPVVAQFIGRFVFVCNLRIDGNYCYLTKVRNIRYWATRSNGLGDLAARGPEVDDKIDDWPDQVIPLDKLGPVMSANKDYWS